MQSSFSCFNIFPNLLNNHHKNPSTIKKKKKLQLSGKKTTPFEHATPYSYADAGITDAS